METYLTLLYVTIEQEVALKELFLSKGWLYAKPDLSVLTSNVGPPESFTSTGGIVKFTDDNGATEQRAKIVHPKVVENEDGIVEDTCVKVEYDDEYGGDTDEVLTGQDYDDDDYNADDHDDDDDFADLVEAAEPVNEAPKETRKSPRNRSKKTKAKSVLTNQKTAQVISFQADGSLAQTVKETPKSKKRKVDGAEVGEGEAVDREDMMGGYVADIEVQLKEVEAVTRKSLAKNRLRTVACPECGKVCNRRHLKFHMVTHYDLPYKCTACRLFFKSEGERLEHVRKKHPKIHMCPQCGKSYNYAVSLRQHMDVSHKREEERASYTCKICDKVFPTRGRLTVHDRSHSEHRPYTCEQCGQSFKCLDHLKKHAMHIHEGLPRKDYCRTFTCEHCAINFKTVTSLKLHILRKHTDKPVFKYVCEICSKSFTRADRLEAHMNKEHYDRKPYYCSDCGKSFFTSQYLKKHLERCDKRRSNSEFLSAGEANNSDQAQAHSQANVTQNITDPRYSTDVMMNMMQVEQRNPQDPYLAAMAGQNVPVNSTGHFQHMPHSYTTN